MIKPKLYNGSTTLSFQHPVDWNIEKVMNAVPTQSLNGASYLDVTSFHYKYTLIYDALHKTDYEALVALINSQYTTGITLRFTYGKFLESITGTDVIGSISGRSRTGGSGIDYYVNFDLVLEEVSSRL